MKIHTIFKAILYQKFFKETKGATAIEFALVAPIYLVILFGIFVIGIWLFANVTLTAVVNEAAVKIMMGHPEKIQSDTYYKQYIQNSLNEYVGNRIANADSSQYVNNTITYSISKTSFSGVENSPVLIGVTIKYAYPCPVPLISNKTFRFSFTGYAAVVGLTPL